MVIMQLKFDAGINLTILQSTYTVINIDCQHNNDKTNNSKIHMRILSIIVYFGLFWFIYTSVAK